MPKIIKIDFDGTIVEDAYPLVGKAKKGALETIKDLQNSGYKLILWTCREGDYLDQATAFLKDNGIEIKVVNDNHPESPYAHLGKSRKPYAHYHIDDRNFGGVPEWSVIHDYFFKIKKYHEQGTDIKPSKKKKAQGYIDESLTVVILLFLWTITWGLPIIVLIYICSVLRWIKIKITASDIGKESHFVIFTTDNTISWFSQIPQKIAVCISILAWINIILFSLIKLL